MITDGHTDGRTDTRTDDGRKVITVTHPEHSSGELKTKGNNFKSKKGRVAILVHDASSCPVLHFYQVSSKYSKGCLNYRADTKLMHNHCQI